MPLKRENRRRQITLNVTPYVYDVDAIALSLINQFKTFNADPEVTILDEHKLSLTFRESDELTYEVACQKILWNQYVQNIEQKNVTTNIELLKRMVDPYFDSPVVAGLNGPHNEVLGDGKGQLDGISPDAFNHGEVLWADGKPVSQPKYILDDSSRPDGPPLLTRDINKAVQPSTITAFKEHYAAMDKDTFFVGDGVMKVGDEFHPIIKDHRADRDLGDGLPIMKRRGGVIGLPNKHTVSIIWGHRAYSDNYKGDIEGRTFNETPHEAEVAIISPNEDFLNLDDPSDKNNVYRYQTTEKAKELIRRAKEL